MAKQNSNTRSNKSTSRKSKKKQTGIVAWIEALRYDPEKRDDARRIAGWSLLFVSILSLLACISYFYYGKIDQSVIEPTIQNQTVVKNWLGQFGAWIANQIIYKGFGIVGLILPVYGIFVALVLLEDEYYVYARRILKYVVFILIWGSMFLSIMFEAFYGEENLYQFINYGGGVGYALNHWLFQYINRLGVAFLLLFAVLLFIVINFKTEVKATKIAKAVSNRIKQPLPKLSADKLKNALPVKRTNKSDSANEDSSDQEEIIEPVVTNSTADNDDNQLGEGLEITTGQQIELDVKPKPINKIKSKPKPMAEPEFVIEQAVGDEEDQPAIPEEGFKEFEQIGEDNIGRVVGSEAQTEKIVPLEDQETANTDEVIDWEEFDPTQELSDYNPPMLELLDDHGYGRNRQVNTDEIVQNKRKIQDTLAHYGIEILSIKATVGPTVTLYEIVPAPGVRISKIRNLEDDIALSLAALGIRIIAPIPGKGTIGIEVPNSNPEIVSLRGVLSTKKFLNTKAQLPIAIGRTISNEVFIGDLNKMPHLLIAGATGQGKSVGLNTVIASILYKLHPAEVKFVLIDPKKVEMSLYQALSHHFLAFLPSQEEPIITDVKEAVTVLKSLCVEMDQRYDLLKKARVRNLKEYNAKFTARRLNPYKGHRFMPFIVLIIDELADMMMIAGKEVEMPIARLAQLARAVGIHLVVATQRPSVNVITGIIKANFPARMSYRVISKVDSRTILDANGADQLIGRGDVLLSTGSDLIRIQNAFIDTPEVERVVDHIAQQRGFTEPYFLPELPGDGDSELDDEPFEKDSNFEEAARLIVRYQQGSASLIQRKLKLGYNRAGRIIDQLEKANIVGPHMGSKPREVLITDEAELERYLENLS